MESQKRDALMKGHLLSGQPAFHVMSSALDNRKYLCQLWFDIGTPAARASDGTPVACRLDDIGVCYRDSTRLLATVTRPFMRAFVFVEPRTEPGAQ